MKIIELCTSPGWGGLELYTLNISEWLKNEGHDCLVVLTPGSLIARRLQNSELKAVDLSVHFKLF
ncbi:MAG: hypothetical protein KAU21_02820, partial [Gammaproteobacteria bacterium]|nr:hypothetical protein [Gammaproteobacteria bacterium]